ncbi:DUF1707 SHOCT-like domain-containing protein [Brevibacterium jeotgali]|uniref:DUF1707 domain-containing protein n=1 Tax=Brevibacterium jeotgali TaxID=1262550 RepID=A0A2H1L446_9MICO|nr:DUF1707 domain-containing protein [Brevibacterium jeotgali]TWB98722.1 uncharacterized protein DUF1707 [Brevibacterium jeotgali]SMY11678.1 protein of unknown function (DUF1707) [Brevibacterium jeotgali]
MSQENVWPRFRLDPRLHTRLRAADEDRDIVRECLGEAFADGRLNREELDERLAAVGDARLLGDLLDALADLFLDAHPIDPDSDEAKALGADAGRGPTPGNGMARTGSGSGSGEGGTLSHHADRDPLSPPMPLTYDEIDTAAREHYAKLVRASLGSFVGASAITTLVWLAIGLYSGGFSLFWPIFVMLGTGINVISTISARQRTIEDRRRKLTRKARERRALDGDPGADGGGSGPRSRSDERREIRRNRNRDRGDDHGSGDPDARDV